MKKESAAVIARLEAQNARLRAALKPFGDYSSKLGGDPDGIILTDPPLHAGAIRQKHFFAARREVYREPAPCPACQHPAHEGRCREGSATPPDEPLSAAFRCGFEAYSLMRLIDNPFPQGSTQAADWERGWKAAQSQEHPNSEDVLELVEKWSKPFRQDIEARLERLEFHLGITGGVK